MASIGARLTGLRWAGFFAAIFWVLNSSGIEPLGWSCVYNQVLCGFFLLLAFHFLLRYVETGARRYNLFQWAAFLLGFGALELNVVYPAIAAAYTLLLRRERPTRISASAQRCRCSPSPSRIRSRTTPRRRVQNIRGYAMHFTGAMFRTLGTYWTWSVGPTFLFTPFVLAEVAAARGNRRGVRGTARVSGMEAARGRACRPILSGVVSGPARSGAAACAITRPSITCSCP